MLTLCSLSPFGALHSDGNGDDRKGTSDILYSLFSYPFAAMEAEMTALGLLITSVPPFLLPVYLQPRKQKWPRRLYKHATSSGLSRWCWAAMRRSTLSSGSGSAQAPWCVRESLFFSTFSTIGGPPKITKLVAFACNDFGARLLRVAPVFFGLCRRPHQCVSTLATKNRMHILSSHNENLFRCRSSRSPSGFPVGRLRLRSPYGAGISTRRWFRTLFATL